MDLDHAVAVATAAATQAGEEMTRALRHPIAFDVQEDIADRVTAVDLACHHSIVAAIRTAFPGAAFLSEEGNLPEVDAAERWIIDPLDGTMNFTRRIPFFGVSIALERHGDVLLGVQHFPLLGRTYAAVRGRGAQCNDEPIAVSSCTDLAHAVVAEFYSDREARGTSVLYPPVTAYRKFGSAILPLAFLAEGAVDAVILRCRRWDYAAAEVIIAEAGGRMTVLPDDPSDQRTAVTCIASTPAMHEQCLAFLREHMRKK